MYRKPRFLKVLHAIREQMSREVDYDVDLFVEMVRAAERPVESPVRSLRVFRNGKDDAESAQPIEAAPRRIKSRRRAAR